MGCLKLTYYQTAELHKNSLENCLTLIKTKKSSCSGYRYGFNGKEKDDEVSGKGNQYDYGFRIYNPKLGRFLSKDPLFRNYAMLTPYQFASNTPIQAIDLDGLEAIQVTGWMENNTVFRTQTVYDNFTSDLRVQYIMHDVGTGTATELWVNPVEIKYEPSAMEKFLAGVDQTLEYAQNGFDAIERQGRSFDNMMKKAGRGSPTFAGKHGFHNGGKQIMVSTVGAVLSGGGMLAAESIGGFSMATGGLLSSADDITNNGNGGTMLGNLTGNQSGVDKLKFGFDIVSFGTGTSSLVGDVVSGKLDNFVLNFSSVIDDEINVLNGVSEIVTPPASGQPNP